MKIVIIFLAFATHAFAAEPIILDLWPGEPPGPARELPAEADLTKPDDKLIAGIVMSGCIVFLYCNSCGLFKASQSANLCRDQSRSNSD